MINFFFNFLFYITKIIILQTCWDFLYFKILTLMEKLSFLIVFKLLGVAQPLLLI